MLIILLVLAIAVLAFVIPSSFVNLSSQPQPIRGDLIVLPGVLLSMTGTATGAVSWPVGVYNNCQISTVSDTCLTANAPGSISTSTFIFGAYTIIELLFVAAIIILLLMVGLYYYRRR